MDIGTFRGIITGLLIIAFLGLTAWAYSRKRKPDFDEAAQLPFADDEADATARDRDAPPPAGTPPAGEAGSRTADSCQDRGDRKA